MTGNEHLRIFSSATPTVQNASNGQPAVWVDNVPESWTVDQSQAVSTEEQWDDKVGNISKRNTGFILNI